MSEFPPSNKKKFKFNHHPSLSNEVLSVICGRSGCGKTYLLFKI